MPQYSSPYVFNFKTLILFDGETDDQTLLCSFSIFLITLTFYPLDPSVFTHLIHSWYSKFTPASFHADAIERLPLAHSPEVFGLHPNSEVSYCTQRAAEMWSDLLELQPVTGEQIFVKEIPVFWCGVSQSFTYHVAYSCKDVCVRV